MIGPTVTRDKVSLWRWPRLPGHQTVYLAPEQSLLPVCSQSLMPLHTWRHRGYTRSSFCVIKEFAVTNLIRGLCNEGGVRVEGAAVLQRKCTGHPGSQRGSLRAEKRLCSTVLSNWNCVVDGNIVRERRATRFCCCRHLELKPSKAIILIFLYLAWSFWR